MSEAKENVHVAFDVQRFLDYVTEYIKMAGLLDSGLCEKIAKKVDFARKSKIEKSICGPWDQPTEP